MSEKVHVLRTPDSPPTPTLQKVVRPHNLLKTLIIFPDIPSQMSDFATFRTLGWDPSARGARPAPPISGLRVLRAYGERACTSNVEKVVPCGWPSWPSLETVFHSSASGTVSDARDDADIPTCNFRSVLPWHRTHRTENISFWRD